MENRYESLARNQEFDAEKQEAFDSLKKIDVSGEEKEKALVEMSEKIFPKETDISNLREGGASNNETDSEVIMLDEMIKKSEEEYKEAQDEELLDLSEQEKIELISSGNLKLEINSSGELSYFMDYLLAKDYKISDLLYKTVERIAKLNLDTDIVSSKIELDRILRNMQVLVYFENGEDLNTALDPLEFLRSVASVRDNNSSNFLRGIFKDELLLKSFTDFIKKETAGREIEKNKDSFKSKFYDFLSRVNPRFRNLSDLAKLAFVVLFVLLIALGFVSLSIYFDTGLNKKI